VSASDLTERFALLPLAARHAIRAGAFPRDHRDPFDRMLVAQAMVEGVALVSRDRGMKVPGAERVGRT